ncbi:MAG: metal-dependent hydrolase [Epsilonproteobacteria bacterium]|nr:metal-dependent hydrolase [Campylobacterota bacterium]
MRVKVTYVGHSCFLFEGSEKIIIDPFISGNPNTKIKPDEIDCNYILVTHGHADHLGDAIGISKNCGAAIIAPYELSTYCQMQGAKNVHPMYIGGSFRFTDNLKIKFTIAHHGSAATGETITYTGNPVGMLIELNEKTIYHAGDTGLFSDMKLIGERNQIDLALLPIGDNFTMGPEDAAYAAGLLNCREVIPMHYNTFDVIRQDPLIFKKYVGNSSNVSILSPGQSKTI